MSNLTSSTPLDLTRRDGEPVKATVIQVSPRKLLDYLAAPDEIARLQLTTDLSPEDIDQLDLASYESLIQADEELNGPFARRRQERQMAEQARQLESMKAAMPELYAQAEAGMVAAMQAAMASSGSSPTPAASPDGPGTTPSTSQSGD